MQPPPGLHISQYLTDIFLSRARARTQALLYDYYTVVWLPTYIGIIPIFP